jgi:hypothetical protein
MGLRGPRPNVLRRDAQPSLRRMSRTKPAAITDPTNRERQKRWRDRQRNGEVPITVDLSEADLETLVLARCLDGRAEYVTPEQIAEALRNFLRLSRSA